MENRLALTGGGGYIGSNLLHDLSCKGYSVVSFIRERDVRLENKRNVTYTGVGDLSNTLNWAELLTDIDCVIHLAGRAHISREHSKNSLADFMKVNCDTTIRLATGAANAGVRRFIYISSIGVLGGETKGVNVFSEESKYNPQDTYSVSKMKAELGLKRLSESVNMEIVIIRPPLVYGACAPGNFNRLLWITSLGIPLPFKGMKAKKSMISLKNLCDLIMMAIVAPLPKFSVFVASDDSCWSTSELVLLISKYMGKKCRLFEVNPTILIVIASLLGRKKEVRKLSTSLCIDASKTLTLLNWSPIQAPEEGLREAIESYSSCSKSK